MSNFNKDEIEVLQNEFNNMMRTRKGSATRKISLRRRTTVQLPQNLQQKMTDYQGSNTIGISKEEFVKIIENLAPSLLQSSGALFDKFDEDGSGYLDFRELTIAMSVLSKGNFEEKLRICFDAFDTDRSGFLQNVEIQLLIEKMLIPYSSAIENDPESVELNNTIINIHQKMNKLTEDFNGKLAFNDFLNGIKADMMLYNCICEYIGNEKPDVDRIVNAINKGTFIEQEERHGGSGCQTCSLL